MDRTEKFLSSNILYSGSIITLRLDQVELPSGKTARREVAGHSPAVGLIPVLDNGNVLLVRQFRYAVGKELLEIPAGIVEKGEDTKEASLRELQEETGYTASSLEKIAEFYTSPGFSDELLIVYLATGLSESRLDPDDDEFIELVEVPPKKLIEMLRTGELSDGKTLSALSLYLLGKEL